MINLINQIKNFKTLFLFLTGKNKSQFFYLISFFIIIGLLDILNASLIFGFASATLSSSIEYVILDLNIFEFIRENIILIFSLIVFFFILRSLTLLKVQIELYKLRFKVEEDLLNRLSYQYLQKKNHRYLSSLKQAVYFESLNKWCQAFAEKVFLTVAQFFGQSLVFFLLFTFSVIFISFHILLILLLLTTAYLILTTKFLVPRLQKISVNLKKFSLEFIQKINDYVLNISVLRDLKLENKVSFEIVRIRNLYNAQLQKRIFYTNLIKILLELFFILIFCTVIISLFILSYQDSLSKFISFSYILYRSKPFFELIATSKSRIFGQLSYVSNLRDILINIESSEKSSSFNIEKQHNFKSLKISNLTFNYNNNILYNNLNLLIKEKDKIFISGESGSGKSTLALILSGVVRIENAKIVLNDQQVQEINLKSFYVPQNSFLFQGSIEDNILMDKTKNVDNDKLSRCLKLSNLDKVVENKKNYQNIDLLSQGEKQRINIARTFYHDNFDIFIFDESTSGLDDINEKRIISNILQFLADKTIIFISHKKNLGEMFEKKYQIDNKKINLINKHEL